MNTLRRIIIFIVILILIVTGGTMIVNANKQKGESERTKYYTSIRIEAGDTLWSIAKEYKTEEYTSIQEYIEELKFMNGLTNDRIRQGNDLTITYYAP